MTPRILRTDAAAEYVGLAAGTLEKMRVQGRGPRFVKLGRAVGYDIRDLDDWLDGLCEPRPPGAGGISSTTVSTREGRPDEAA